MKREGAPRIGARRAMASCPPGPPAAPPRPLFRWSRGEGRAGESRPKEEQQKWGARDGGSCPASPQLSPDPDVLERYPSCFACEATTAAVSRGEGPSVTVRNGLDAHRLRRELAASKGKQEVGSLCEFHSHLSRLRRGTLRCKGPRVRRCRGWWQPHRSGQKQEPLTGTHQRTTSDSGHPAMQAAVGLPSLE